MSVMPVLLSPEDTGSALGVGRTTVYRLMKSGELRSVKVGKCRRVPYEEVRAYAARLVEQAAAGRYEGAGA